MKLDFVLKLDGTKFVVPCLYHQRQFLLVVNYCDVARRRGWILSISCGISRVSSFVRLNERVAMHRFVFKGLVWRSVFWKGYGMRILLSPLFRILMWILRWSSCVKCLFCNLNVNLNLLIAYEWLKTCSWCTLLNYLRQYLLLFVSV